MNKDITAFSDQVKELKGEVVIKQEKIMNIEESIKNALKIFSETNIRRVGNVSQYNLKHIEKASLFLLELYIRENKKRKLRIKENVNILFLKMEKTLEKHKLLEKHELL